MIFTIFYMYSTFVQWWRLGTLKNKLRGTLNGKNALLVCAGNTISEPDHHRSLENLLFQNDDRIACTVVPRQIVNLNQWLKFPRDQAQFPIHIGPTRTVLTAPKIFLLIRANLEHYQPHQAEIIEIERFGEMFAWRATNFFEVILKTDFDNVAKLVNCLANGNIDINHELKLLKIEVVDLEGNLMKIKYDKVFPLEQKLKYSCAEVHWRNFVTSLKEIYSKIHDVTINPKIMIENGTKFEESKKVPVSEVKPIKKETKRKDSEIFEDKKDTLEVHQKKAKDVRTKTKESKSPKAQSQHKTGKEEHKKDAETRHREERRHHREERHRQLYKSRDDIDGLKSKEAKAGHRSKEDKRKEIGVKAGVSNGEVKTMKNEAIEGSSSKDSGRKVNKQPKGENVSSVAATTTLNASDPIKSGDDTPCNGDVISPVALNEDFQNSNSFADATSNQDLLTSNYATSTSKEFQAFTETPETEAGQNARIQSKANVTNIIEEKNIKFSETKRALRKSSKSSKNTKPPNVLVYADSLVTKENVKEVLGKILNKEKYTIYDLPLNKSYSFWDESTTLAVVCGNVTPNLTSDLLHYLVNGGQLLCLCSDLLYAILQTFSTAEVREHELVRFSYGEWKGVKMMHHIFCYQPSPAKKQFSKDSDQSNHSGGESSPIAPRTPSVVEIQHNGKTYTIQVQVLGAEETWQTPSLLLASVKDGSGGKAVFSQVHLEVDPLQYQDDENVYTALQDSNSARLQILKNILSSHLDMDCQNCQNEEIKYSLGYLLGRHDMKLQMLNDNENIIENKLVGDNLTIVFCGKDNDPGPPSSSRLPVLILSCPAYFSTVQYFETLETKEIGRLVIYSDVVTSSQDVLSRKLKHGLVMIPRQQTRGVGRSDNIWLSPMGCAMFSLQLHIPTKSLLGNSLPLVQHIVMVAIVSAVRSQPGYQDLEIGLKWPNDLYAYSRVKIGGLIVNSQINQDVAVVNIGCGVNLDNSNPTVSLNDIIGKFNVDHGTTLTAIPQEKYFALVFNEVERVLKIVESGDMKYFYDLYYKYWLHSDSDISVTTKDNQARKVKIVGIDDFGYLTVKSPDGTVSAVQPDGNTFDMLKGLIAPKIN